MANPLPPNEILYRAIRQLEPDGTVSPADICFPDISVNRALLSTPQELIVGKSPPVGVCSFLVSDIPQDLFDQTNQNNYTFMAFEDPIPTNLAHSEIRTYVDDVYTKKDPPKSIRRTFRIILAAKIKIVIVP